MFPQCSQFPTRVTLFPVSVFVFTDPNYACATQQGTLRKIRACEHLQNFCEHEQASTHLIFASTFEFDGTIRHPSYTQNKAAKTFV